MYIAKEDLVIKKLINCSFYKNLLKNIKDKVICQYVGGSRLIGYETNDSDYDVFIITDSNEVVLSDYKLELIIDNHLIHIQIQGKFWFLYCFLNPYALDSYQLYSFGCKLTENFLNNIIISNDNYEYEKLLIKYNKEIITSSIYHLFHFIIKGTFIQKKRFPKQLYSIYYGYNILNDNSFSYNFILEVKKLFLEDYHNVEGIKNILKLEKSIDDLYSTINEKQYISNILTEMGERYENISSLYKHNK